MLGNEPGGVVPAFLAAFAHPPRLRTSAFTDPSFTTPSTRCCNSDQAGIIAAQWPQLAVVLETDLRRGVAALGDVDLPPIPRPAWYPTLAPPGPAT